MDVKELLKDYSLKKAALLLAERRLQLMENPGDDTLFEQTVGMVHMAYGVFNNYGLKALYDYYIRQLEKPLPKPGEIVLFYDRIDGQPKQARVIESRDSMTLDRPKMV